MSELEDLRSQLKREQEQTAELAEDLLAIEDSLSATEEDRDEAIARFESLQEAVRELLPLVPVVVNPSTGVPAVHPAVDRILGLIGVGKTKRVAELTQ